MAQASISSILESIIHSMFIEKLKKPERTELSEEQGLNEETKAENSGTKGISPLLKLGKSKGFDMT